MLIDAGRLAAIAAALAGAASAAGAQPAISCQAIGPGVNTLRGVIETLQLTGPAAGAPPAQGRFALVLEKPLCAGSPGLPRGPTADDDIRLRLVELVFPGEPPRRYLGQRVVVSGTVLPDQTPHGRRRLILQVGSLMPLPQVAGDKT